VPQRPPIVLPKRVRRTPWQSFLLPEQFKLLNNGIEKIDAALPPLFAKAHAAKMVSVNCELGIFVLEQTEASLDKQLADLRKACLASD
jgi:hypothetical protein